MKVLSFERLKFSLKYFPKILTKFFVILVVLQGINFFFNQIMVYLQEARMSSKEDFFVPMIIILAFVGFLVQSAVKVVWTLVICRFFIGKEDLASYIRNSCEQGLIESLRAFLKSIIFGFLLIIPGIIKMIRYQFVVLVVATDKDYQQGRVDALKESERLAFGKTWPLFFLLVLFSILSLSATSDQLIYNAPLSVISTETAAFCINVFEALYMYLLFVDLKSAKGLDTAMEPAGALT